MGMTNWEPVELDARKEEQLDAMEDKREVVVALSATMWKVVFPEDDENGMV